MRRLIGVMAGVNWSEGSRRLAGWLNPVVASPAAPSETVAALDALGPSLMPRTSRLAGTAMGLSVLGDAGECPRRRAGLPGGGAGGCAGRPAAGGTGGAGRCGDGAGPVAGARR
jgi:hypothetical protein